MKPLRISCQGLFLRNFCLVILFLAAFALVANGQERRQNYYPEGDSFVCVNGENRFTRPLYGTNTAWRLETSDRPVFASYSKAASYNISLSINGVRLDETEFCKAFYTPGKRTYIICDSRVGQGSDGRVGQGSDGRVGQDSIYLTAIPLADREGALFAFSCHPFQASSSLDVTAVLSGIKAKKLSRAGDLGADAADSFEAGEKIMEVSSKAKYLLFENIHENSDANANGKSDANVNGNSDANANANANLRFLSDEEGEALLAAAESRRERMAGAMRIVTPDHYINTLGGALAMAADGCWDDASGVWQHGANGWRMPLNGWRCGYIGDCLGWFDRAETHFNNYAASQVTDVEPVIPHPAQDTVLNLARAEKRWGTQMYSNGYICRNPNRNNQMHHYDMNLVYIDALLWHILWTGDKDYARRMFPVIKRHLAWEKRNFDPDDDGLYDAYCCIWASDALYYNSGTVTHSSAYNYRANKIAADIAENIGEDPAPYRAEAAKIKAAINATLWLKDEGVWAEFKDFMGKKRLHESPAVWTVYHAIDSDVSDIGQYYRATRWIDRNIPHIPIEISSESRIEISSESRIEISSDSRNLGFSDSRTENNHLQTISTTNWLPYSWSINNVAFAEVYHTALAYWQAARPDEAFRLFKANVMDGMYLGKCPGNFGQISYYDKARGECYRDFSDCVGIASRTIVQGLFGIYPDMLNNRIVIRPGFPSDWDHAELHTSYIDYVFDRKDGKNQLKIETHFGREVEVVVENVKGEISWQERQDGGERPIALMPAFTETERSENAAAFPKTERSENAAAFPKVAKTVPVSLEKHFNAKVRDIFRNRYLSPRSPYTTLQIPAQGIGDWCSPKETAEIESEEPIVFTSLWDNYPDAVEIPLPRKRAVGIRLEMAGSTNHMQCHIENAVVKVTYTDGTQTLLPLVPPETWAPIEQDFYLDGKAFRRDEAFPPLQRRRFKTGEVYLDTENAAPFNQRHIDGGASVILNLRLNPEKKTKSLTLETLSNDVVVGLLRADLILP